MFEAVNAGWMDLGVEGDAACETAAYASQCRRTYYVIRGWCSGWPLLASDGLGVERAMGIEYIAREKQMILNHHVATADECCVRFLREKRCHTGQGQPMRALVMGTGKERGL
jgi:hypothetical protein